jgi:hypothetical protein
MRRTTELEQKLLNLDSLRSAYAAYRDVTLARMKDGDVAPSELQTLCDFLGEELADLERERKSLLELGVPHAN